MRIDEVVSEASFKKWFLDRTFERFSSRVHIVNVDLSDSPGMPDTNWCVGNTEGWIEFKWVKHMKPSSIRPAQTVWFRARRETGNNFSYLVWASQGDAIDHMWQFGIIRGEAIPRLKGTLTRVDAEEFSVKRWRAEGFTQWFEIREILLEGR